LKTTRIHQKKKNIQKQNPQKKIKNLLKKDNNKLKIHKKNKSKTSNLVEIYKPTPLQSEIYKIKI